MIKEIAFTGTSVTDMKRARAFYEGGLGLWGRVTCMTPPPLLRLLLTAQTMVELQCYSRPFERVPHHSRPSQPYPFLAESERCR